MNAADNDSDVDRRLTELEAAHHDLEDRLDRFTDLVAGVARAISDGAGWPRKLS